MRQQGIGPGNGITIGGGSGEKRPPRIAGIQRRDDGSQPGARIQGRRVDLRGRAARARRHQRGAQRTARVLDRAQRRLGGAGELRRLGGGGVMHPHHGHAMRDPGQRALQRAVSGRGLPRGARCQFLSQR
ncbi:MAG: hypothetical protein ACE368_03060 [Paracoccaceae bacterium]